MRDGSVGRNKAVQAIAQGRRFRRYKVNQLSGRTTLFCCLTFSGVCLDNGVHYSYSNWINRDISFATHWFLSTH